MTVGSVKDSDSTVLELGVVDAALLRPNRAKRHRRDERDRQQSMSGSDRLVPLCVLFHW